MIKKLLLIVILFLPFAEASAVTKTVRAEIINEGNVVLSDVLTASNEIAEFTPSYYVAKIDDNIINIGQNRYEIRLFYFEDVNKKLTMSFQEFCKSNDLMENISKIMDQGYGPIEFFASNEKLKRDGIHFLISLRKID